MATYPLDDDDTGTRWLRTGDVGVIDASQNILDFRTPWHSVIDR